MVIGLLFHCLLLSSYCDRFRLFGLMFVAAAAGGVVIVVCVFVCLFVCLLFAV